MRPHTISYFALGLSLCSAYRQGALPPAPRTPSLPAWLAGCWAARTPSDTLEEYWTVPRGGVMLGISRLVHNDSLVSYEQNRIEVRDTSLAFVSNELNERIEEYLAVDQAPDIIAFETPGSVAKERIRYRREANTLRVRFARRANGKEQGVEEPMTLVSCDQESSIPGRSPGDEELKNVGTRRVEELLAGRFAGVRVMPTPAGGFSIRIRTSNVLPGHEPLYIIDGMKVSVDPARGLDFLDAADIAHIDVLRNPAETNAYGSQGANGVVVITTKRSQNRLDVERLE